MSNEENTVKDQNEINETAGTSENRGKGVRILAWILLGIYAVLLGVFIFFIVSGSQYILQMLFIVIIYPVILYIIIWLRKVFDK